MGSKDLQGSRGVIWTDALQVSIRRDQSNRCDIKVRGRDDACEAAQVMLTRTNKWSWLKAWAMQIARRRGMRKAIVALARRLAVILHRIWVDGTDFRWTRKVAAACVVKDQMR